MLALRDAAGSFRETRSSARETVWKPHDTVPGLRETAARPRDTVVGPRETVPARDIADQLRDVTPREPRVAFGP